MELFEASVDGQWEYNYDKEMDFFIINDAIVSKLCILGDDVEPCFEGASVTKPEVSKKFTLDDNFKNTLYSMLQDLKNVLNGGEKQMENETTLTFTEQEAATVEETSVEETPVVDETSVSSDFAKKDDEKEKETSDEKLADDGKEDEAKEDEGGEEEKDDNNDKEKDKKNFALLSQELEELKTSYSALQTQYQELLSFKTEIENQKKDALISEFYMLADEDKADVIANKEKYTLDEIKAKLSVICFDKKISFSAASEEPVTNKEEKAENILTYSFAPETNSLPDWVRMVKEEMK